MLLGLDIGSSSVKAAVLRGTDIVGGVAKVEFKTTYDGPKVEVDPEAILKAIRGAIRQVGNRAGTVDAVGISVMAPAWVAMDAKGRALTPIVTHQDRRSVDEAIAIEQRVGKERHLRLAGNRPFPGGISSTTWAWFKRHEPHRVRRADLVGHLNTFLHRHLTGERVIDSSNASFTGLYKTLTLDGWSDELCAAAAGISKKVLPDVYSSDHIAGKVSREGARRFGLPEGLPVLAGLVDGSAGMLLAGAKIGQLLNVSGSTDVLALCVDQPHPHEKLLTRAVGVGRKWVSVSTLAAAGSALNWAKEQFFVDLSDDKYWKLVSTLAKRPPASRVSFDNYLAGERTSIEQRTATISCLTLASTRRDILAALLDDLAVASAARLQLLKHNGVPFRRDVVVAGGVGRRLSSILHRDWPGKWKFVVPPDEATLRGLGTLEANAER